MGGFSPLRTNCLEGAGWEDCGRRALMTLRLLSSVAARHLNTWLCRQVYQPCARLALHPTKMCFRSAEDGQRRHVGSPPYHWLRFSGVGRTSNVAGMMKLDRNASMSYSSLHEIFHFVPSYEIAVAQCAACSLSAYLLHHETSLLRPSCLVPGQLGLPKTKASSPLVHIAYNVPELEG